jgi:hypothetical protein
MRIDTDTCRDPDLLAAEVRRLRAAITALVDQDATLAVCNGNVTVEMDATLTDAEREAVATAMNDYAADNADPECAGIEATLWGLLERTLPSRASDKPDTGARDE